MRFTVQALQGAGLPAERIYVSMERNMKCGIGLCGHCQFGAEFVCKEARCSATTASPPSSPCGRSEHGRGHAWRCWKFASCDGCQLSLLDCEDELLAVAGAVEIAYFPEASRAVQPGPYDVSLVEGIDHHASTMPSASAECATQSRC